NFEDSYHYTIKKPPASKPALSDTHVKKSPPLKDILPTSKSSGSSSDSNITKFFDYDYTVKKPSISTATTEESKPQIVPATSSFNIKVPSKSNPPSSSEILKKSDSALEFKATDPEAKIAASETKPKNEGGKNEMKTITFPNGQKYIGEMKNGKMHGKGKMSSPDGPTFEGDWEQGVMHGYGTLTWPGGNNESGWWERGKFKGETPPEGQSTPPSKPSTSSPSPLIAASESKELVSELKSEVIRSPSALNFEDSYNYTIKKPPASKPAFSESKIASPSPALSPISPISSTGAYDYKVKKSSPLKDILPTPKSSGSSADSNITKFYDYSAKKPSSSKSEETVFAPDLDPIPPELPLKPPKNNPFSPSEILKKSDFVPEFKATVPKTNVSNTDTKTINEGGKNEMKTITFPNGQKYVGEMKNGKMHGKGKMSSPDGPTYEGDWGNGVMHGYGTLTWPGGNNESGWWERGKFKGETPPESL
ncbi:MAG: hypothetical protein AABZ60_08145, partial [Planctomycetota bacterium]